MHTSSQFALDTLLATVFCFWSCLKRKCESITPFLTEHSSGNRCHKSDTLLNALEVARKLW